MKFLVLTAALLPWLHLRAESPAEQHQQAANLVADRQDELSADVQQLAIEQTVPQVIELLGQVKSIMNEATDQLATANTGGDTIAAQTEVIEKIHAAAKAKQQAPGSSPSGNAMMDMMERMMGKKDDSTAPGTGQTGEAGDQAGNGQKGDSVAANSNNSGSLSGKDNSRRIPKASGNNSHPLPQEFQTALDAYNRGAEAKLK